MPYCTCIQARFSGTIGVILSTADENLHGATLSTLPRQQSMHQHLDGIELKTYFLDKNLTGTAMLIGRVLVEHAAPYFHLSVEETTRFGRDLWKTVIEWLAHSEMACLMLINKVNTLFRDPPPRSL